MTTKQVERVAKIRRKFGRDAFRKWGSEENGGGSPILIAAREGRVTIHGRRAGKKNGSRRK